MASEVTIRQVNRALQELSDAAKAEFLEGFSRIDPRLQWHRNQFVREFFPGLIEKYGIIASSVGADVFEAEARALGIRPSVELAPGVNAERASARLMGELNMTTTLATALQLTDELVRQPYRSTFQDSAYRSGAGWARVPVSDTCQFCIMLASRGGVYASSDIAEFGFSGKKYHGDCDCVPVLVRGPEDYPEGYDPDAMYGDYLRARDAVGDYFDTRSILAKMREMYGGH